MRLQCYCTPSLLSACSAAMSALAVLLLMIPAVTAQLPRFIQEPVSVNTTVGSTAVFTCVCIATGQFWLIHDLATTHLDHKHRNVTTDGPLPPPAGSPEGSEKYILKVPAVDANDNIEIRCSAYYNNQVNSSAPIYLRIQGLLEPVQNLTAKQINRTAFTLQYEHPPSLAGVPYWYTIHISSHDGATDREVNTTDDEFRFVTSDWCDVYKINITSVNEVGEGGTNAISVNFMNGPLIEGNVNHTVLFSSSMVVVLVKFQVNNECFIKYPMNITIESVGSDHILELGPCQLGGAQSTLITAPPWCPMLANNTTQSDWSKLSANLTNMSLIEAHTHYTLRVTASNVFGTASSNTFNLCTTFVTNATAQHIPSAGLICVRCTFADGDYSSSGCLVQIINSDSGSVVKSFLVPKTQHKTSQNCENEPQLAGLYSIAVYDTDINEVALGKQPVFILDGVFLVSTPQSSTQHYFPTSPLSSNFALSGVLHTTVLVPELGALSDATSTALFAGVVVAMIAITVLVLLLAVLTGCLIYTKRKAAKYKIARQQDATMMVKASNPMIAGLQGCDLPAGSPIYDNAQELLVKCAGEDSSQAMSFQQCVAYGQLPFQQKS